MNAFLKLKFYILEVLMLLSTILHIFKVVLPISFSYKIVGEF